MKIEPAKFSRRKMERAVDMGLEGARIITAGFRRKLTGHRTYPGSAKAICEAIVHACFHPKKRYFQTSLTTYTDFWSRDFGRCVPALIQLGYRDKVLSSYRYAFERYEQKGRFALVITPHGNLFDFPYYAPDGFAFFLSGLVHLDEPDLIATHRAFLNREMARFFRKVIDPKTGLVRSNRHFSEAQDFSKRTSSCYSNAMCHLLKQCARKLALDNPMAHYDYTSLILDNFWNGDHFYDDLMHWPYISGDACITPFLVNAIDDAKSRFSKVLKRMDEARLTKPFLARYGNTSKKIRPMIRIERFNQWQRDTIWTCLGLQLLSVLERYAPERYDKELSRYEGLVDEFRCFPELLTADGTRFFRGPFYMADDSMLWAADLLYMLKKRDGDLPSTTGDIARFDEASLHG